MALEKDVVGFLDPPNAKSRKMKGGVRQGASHPGPLFRTKISKNFETERVKCAKCALLSFVQRLFAPLYAANLVAFFPCVRS